MDFILKLLRSCLGYSAFRSKQNACFAQLLTSHQNPWAYYRHSKDISFFALGYRTLLASFFRRATQNVEAIAGRIGR
jgi:hypothetical protein